MEQLKRDMALNAYSNYSNGLELENKVLRSYACQLCGLEAQTLTTEQISYRMLRGLLTKNTDSMTLKECQEYNEFLERL